MSTRPQTKPMQVITNGDMSGDITSLVTVLSQQSMCSYSFSWAASSPVGTISVQCSNDYSQNADGSVKNSGTWNSLTVELSGNEVTSIPISGNTGIGFIDIDQLAAYAVRVIYTASSGTGSLQVTFTGKVA